MGIAIIVPDISFADANLGKVNISGSGEVPEVPGVPVQELRIVAEDSYTGTNAQLSVSYIPTNTTQRGVDWSIVSGSNYASINHNTGKLTILEGASNSNITVRVVSLFNSEISATKSLFVSYKSNESTPILKPWSDADYIIPLINDSTPTKGNIEVIKENASFSNEGALFDAVGEGIVYSIPSKIQAISFDVKKIDVTSSNTNFLFNIGPCDGTQYSKNGWYCYTLQNDTEIYYGQGEIGDNPTNANIKKNEWCRICFGHINNILYIFIDGVKVATKTISTNDNDAYLIIGNGWRYRVNNGDRFAGSYIRNVACYTTQQTESKLMEISNL